MTSDTVKDEKDSTSRSDDTSDLDEDAVADEIADATGQSGEVTKEPVARAADGSGRRLSISVKSLVVAVLIAAVAAAAGVMGWLYLDTRQQFDNLTRQDGDNGHAEQVALDYAVNAAVMDYKDLGPWKQKLVQGTTPELGDKLTKAANAMEQIVLPLQWTSTAKPLAAKVRSHINGVYIVDAFVSVMTKTVQAPDNLQSTATYSVTIDSNNSWHITDVGGIGAAARDR
jgi:hypothetical protein